jgi:hypothetical protein
MSATFAAPSRTAIAAWGCAAALSIAGCGERGTPVAGPASAASTVPTSPARAETDAWLGQWTGPEGTFLRVDGGQGRYDITIRNLDGPRSFRGSADGPRIRFERDGVPEALQATDGAGTGMKWLAGKSNCLTVRPGEGYCRE